MSNETQSAAELDGLTFLRERMAAGEDAPMGQTLSMSLIEVEEGRAVVEGRPTRNVYNPMGTVHGGYAATLLDSACGLAVHSRLAARQGHTTLELKVSYLRALTEDSGVVRGEGRVISMGRRVAFAEATLHDGNGRLCATATSTLLLL